MIELRDSEGETDPIELDYSFIDLSKLINFFKLQKLNLDYKIDPLEIKGLELKDALKTHAYQLIKGKNIEDPWFEQFSKVVDFLGVPLVDHIFGCFVADNIKGKSADEINKILGTKQDLTPLETKKLEAFFEEDINKLKI